MGTRSTRSVHRFRRCWEAGSDTEDDRDFSSIRITDMPLLRNSPTIVFSSEVAKWTHKYWYTDWVVEKTGKDRDGNNKQKKCYSDCPANK